MRRPLGGSELFKEGDASSDDPRGKGTDGICLGCRAGFVGVGGVERFGAVNGHRMP